MNLDLKTVSFGLPYTKREIVEQYPLERDVVHTFFSELSLDLFFAAPAGVWSPAENLVHLIKSKSGVVRALTLPKAALRLRFGTSGRASRPFDAVRAHYYQFVTAGTAITTPQFEPDVEAKSAAEREKILAKWHEKGEELVGALASWSEDQLDQFQVPHPLMGNVTMREILFFTMFHNLTHVNDVSRLLGRPEVEWFEMES